MFFLRNLDVHLADSRRRSLTSFVEQTGSRISQHSQQSKGEELQKLLAMPIWKRILTAPTRWNIIPSSIDRQSMNE